ncbi:NAD-dependent protein deacylase Sirt4 [Frankliniella fusca]|uniref:NAD-dependent protein deacylase Sirt4 n=1 Tax=Frankliniella fusca TaxID=407009 RepID=A0AAE1L757_9NEOP|nr:NAD-dependent protein deacylase Sirt4 [Frankliniella fusca]
MFVRSLKRDSATCFVTPRCFDFITEKFIRRHSSTSFVPKHLPVREEDIDKLDRLISVSRNILILTGAGISTESGIPDYRSEGVGLYARSTNRPVQYRDFLKSEAVRRRYWARNYVGWPRFSSFSPNETHLSVRKLVNDIGIARCVVTQNVDSLHTKAKTRNVIELHGSAYRVVCINCDFKIERHAFQDLLANLNPDMQIIDQMIRPDGDVEMNQDQVEGFNIPSCPSCAGLLKPDIVFFGDNVPKNRVEQVRNEVQLCDTLLVLGSSLTVFSAYRIILQASELHKPIAIVNIGETRGDKHALIKISAKCGDVLPHLCR